MSIATEIARLQTLRNNIRTKLINLGVFSNASADLDDCYTALNGITKQTTATVNGATVTVGGGYHNGAISGTVASGTQGTPTATKGTVSGNAVSVTPRCTDTTGYIAGTTKTGTAVQVSASELVSGTKSITANGTYDVTNFASASVNVPTVNCKHWTWSQSNPATNTWFTVVSNDADVAAHYNDASAQVVFAEQAGATTNGLVFSIVRNSVIGRKSNLYGMYANTNTSDAFAALNISTTLQSGTATIGAISADENGNIKVYSGTVNNVIRNGTYDIWFMW